MIEYVEIFKAIEKLKTFGEPLVIFMPPAVYYELVNDCSIYYDDRAKTLFGCKVRTLDYIDRIQIVQKGEIPSGV